MKKIKVVATPVQVDRVGVLIAASVVGALCAVTLVGLIAVIL